MNVIRKPVQHTKWNISKQYTSKILNECMHAHLIHKRVSNKETDDFAINSKIHIQNVTWIVKLKGGCTKLFNA